MGSHFGRACSVTHDRFAGIDRKSAGHGPRIERFQPSRTHYSGWGPGGPAPPRITLVLAPRRARRWGVRDVCYPLRVRGSVRTSRRAALVALVILTVGEAGCGRTEKDVQRDYARTLRPAQLADRAPEQRVRNAPVRVLVDDEYRTEILRWQDRIEAQIERANRVLVAQFGVRLTVREIRPWERSGRARTLSAAMDDLVRDDPGSDVDWVIGFVSSSELFSGSHEQLGMARVFGRHIVLRGMVSFEEGEAFRRVLDKLSDADREGLLHERQLHRESAVLLHEWAHTLGAFHERDDDSLLSPRYHHSQAAFSPTTVRVVQLGLEHRASQVADGRPAWAAAYRAEVERARRVAWDEETVQGALEATRALESGPPGPPPSSAGAAAERRSPATSASAPPGVGAHSRDADLLAEAEMNARLGDAARAWKLVEPMATRFPERWQLQQYACHLRRRAGARLPPADACRGTKAPSTRQAALLFARVLVEAGDRRGAAAALVRAEASLAAGAPPATPADWVELAEQLASIDACTVAERVAARIPANLEARRIVASCERTRRRAALPRDGAGVQPEREPEYVEAVLRGRGQALAGRAGAARAVAAEVEDAFPRAPGGPLLRCLAEASGGNLVSARTACAAADVAAPWAFEPPFVLAEMAGHEGRWIEARDHLRQALERAEQERDVWARLGAVYRKLGDLAELEALDRRHQARFGSKLRPVW